MDDSTGVDRYLVARIVTSYLRHNKIAADQMDALIAGVRRSLVEVGRRKRSGCRRFRCGAQCRAIMSYA
jgi:predicted transcriptional regulator